MSVDVVRWAEFAAYIKTDIAKWKKVITDAKIPQIGG
jgi:tripartite-type tricarboxylate transporter receptor subunit TctC